MLQLEGGGGCILNDKNRENTFLKRCQIVHATCQHIHLTHAKVGKKKKLTRTEL